MEKNTDIWLRVGARKMCVFFPYFSSSENHTWCDAHSTQFNCDSKILIRNSMIELSISIE